MSILTTPGAPPIFLSPSYVNSQASLNATSMNGILYRIAQMDPTAYWQGSLGASTEQIFVGFMLGSQQIAVSLDTVILLNNNFDNFTIYYTSNFSSTYPGSVTWTTLAAVTGNGGADYVNFLPSPLTNVNGLLITATTTYPNGQNKKLGNFIAALSSFQMSVPPTAMKPSYRQRRIDVPLADGSTDTTYQYWSDNSFTMTDYEMEVDFANVYNGSDKDNFDALFKSATAFLFYPEPGDAPRNIHLSLFDTRSYVAGYNSQWKNGGRKIPFKTMMVGFS